MIEFILNDQEVKTDKAEGTTLLDYIRKEHRLLGTKIGCREGDCGACTVLEGTLNMEAVEYISIVSCLTPLINVHGKHIITVEGLNMDELSPVQKAMVDNAATQCGFCTPGFVVSLTGHLLSRTHNDPIEAISGNICRCTGYKSIEKAAHEVDDLKKKLNSKNRLEDLVKRNGLPEYFLSIPQMLSKIKSLENTSANKKILMGGGTDLMVQQPDDIRHSALKATEKNIPNTIEFESGKIKVGAGITMSDFLSHTIIQLNYPQFKTSFALIASEQIRNMGTLAGNIVNASPIGDLSVLFLALDAYLIIEDKAGGMRQLKLNKFFIDYKKISLKTKEWISFIVFDTLNEGQKINFEKVSKRTYLDIASVNMAIRINVNDEKIQNIDLSAGGIAPIPKYLFETNNFLMGKKLDTTTLSSALDVMHQEISPISDIRGSEEYKRLLLNQLFLKHFLTLYPEVFKEEKILELMTSKSISI